MSNEDVLKTSKTKNDSLSMSAESKPLFSLKDLRKQTGPPPRPKPASVPAATPVTIQSLWGPSFPNVEPALEEEKKKRQEEASSSLLLAAASNSAVPSQQPVTISPERKAAEQSVARDMNQVKQAKVRLQVFQAFLDDYRRQNPGGSKTDSRDVAREIYKTMPKEEKEKWRQEALRIQAQTQANLLLNPTQQPQKAQKSKTPQSTQPSQQPQQPQQKKLKMTTIQKDKEDDSVTETDEDIPEQSFLYHRPLRPTSQATNIFQIPQVIPQSVLPPLSADSAAAAAADLF